MDQNSGGLELDLSNRNCRSCVESNPTSTLPFSPGKTMRGDNSLG